MSRPTKAIIDLDALQQNLEAVKQLTGPGVELLPVVKAEAYGHGALPVTRMFERQGIETFCVALVGEALELVSAGIKGSFIILGGIYDDEVREVVEHDLVPVISDESLIDKLDNQAKAAGKIVSVELKIDTGMGRLGADVRQAAKIVDIIKSKNNLRLSGVMSHLSCADSKDFQDVRYTKNQIESFALVNEGLKSKGMDEARLHLAASSAIIEYPGAHFSAVRPGIMLYGVSPSEQVELPEKFKPVMSLESQIVFLRSVPRGSDISYGRKKATKCESLIAVVPIGYADGLPRPLDLETSMLVRGKKARLAGAVTMDMIMIDVTEIPGVSLGDIVTIIGQQGENKISAEDLARDAGTIGYEILTRVAKRVPREYR